MFREIALTGAVLMFGGLVIGCESKPTMEVVPVAGVVRLDGEPAEGVMVTFFPEGATSGGGGAGLSDSSGRFTIQAGPGLDGLPPGNYRVLFEKFAMPDGSPVPPDMSPTDAGATNVLPAGYSIVEQSRFQATVPAANESDMTFDLTSSGR